MKRNGFTFIEILGVITLLALLSIIVLTVVDKNLKNSKDTLSEVQIENIKSAASMWRTDNIELVPEDGYYTLTLGELINLGYISDVIDPDSNENYNRNLIVKVNINSVLIDEESSIDDIIDSDVNSEIELIKSNINSGVMDGVYYYNNVGNLERNASIIYLSRNWNRPRGNILVHNHQFISGCISIGINNYDYYKGVVTKLNYSCSTNRGDNLFVNGDLSFGDNTGFSSFTYNSDGYLSYTGGSTTLLSSLFIPIDIEKKYEYGVTVKTNNTSTKVYMGYYPVDIDHNFIQTYQYSYIANTLTTLARDLNNGDTYIYLTDMTNWNTTTTQTYQHGFIFWNYVDSTGYHYPELTYSRNAWSNLYDNTTTEVIDDVEVVTNNIEKNVEVDGQMVNRIKLKSAWNKGNIPAGTKLSQGNDGSTYPYALVAGTYLSTDWSDKNTVIQGIGGFGYHNKFKNGQRYFKFMVMPDYSGYTNVTTYYKDFYLREVVE